MQTAWLGEVIIRDLVRAPFGTGIHRAFCHSPMDISLPELETIGFLCLSLPPILFASVTPLTSMELVTIYTSVNESQSGPINPDPFIVPAPFSQRHPALSPKHPKYTVPFPHHRCRKKWKGSED